MLSFLPSYFKFKGEEIMYRYLNETGKYGDPEIGIYREGIRIGAIKESKGGWDGNGYFADTNGYRTKVCKTISEVKREILLHEKKDPAKPQRTRVWQLPASPDTEFYPTPQSLAGKMLGKVKWKNVRSILEPSAGKGDILDAAMQLACDYRNKRLVSYEMEHHFCDVVDTLEIDSNMRLILKGKGYKVIGDDFLTFTTQKRYDLIIMNPPFSNGDEHLLKAISLMQHGGQIICLLNAETIRNQYTNRRKLLNQQLQHYGAHIEFICDAFKHAERKSDVEVALVSMTIPSATRASAFFEKMREAEEVERSNTENEPTALVSGNWMSAMVSAFNVEAKAGLALMDEWFAMKPYIMDGTESYSSPLIELKVGDHAYNSPSEAANTYLESLRKKYWKQLFSRRELTEKMTSKMMDDYSSRISDMAKYDFNMYNIQQLYYEIGESLLQGVQDSIMELFDTLSAKHAWFPECGNNIHYYNGWRTNECYKVGMKAIIPVNGAFAEYGIDEGKLHDYRIAGVVSDLERVMNYLDRGETVFHSNPTLSIRQANETGKTVVDFTYFSAKFYKKGTCHIKFHEDARHIIDRLNIYAAQDKNWLPPSYGKKHYADMSDEEKRVIDTFHESGAEEYENTVMANPGYYLTNKATLQKALPS